MAPLLLLLLLLLLSVTTLVSAIPRAPPPPPLFVLGDSSAGCTLNTFLSPLLPGNSSCPNHLLPDLLAKKMGLPRIPPFYAATFAGTDAGALARGGANFGAAWGKIVSGGPSSVLFQGLHAQLTLAFDTVQVLQLGLGRARADRAVSSAVFYLSFGKDDYVELLSGESALVAKYGTWGLARVLAPMVLQAVEDLCNVGARKVVVMGVIPLGCTPMFASEGNRGSGNWWGCANEINNLVVEYNELLAEGVWSMSSRLPGVKMAFCDVYKGLMKIMSNPHLYGFEDWKNACCALRGITGMLGCLSKEVACQFPSKYVWWDLNSPTAAINALLANWSWSGFDMERICMPLTLSELV